MEVRWKMNDKVLVAFVTLYEKAEELIGTEYVTGGYQDWLMHGDEINEFVRLLKAYKQLFDDTKIELVIKGLREG
jgi:hypothetical protein